jgi:hypothetical protein
MEIFKMSKDPRSPRDSVREEVRMERVPIEKQSVLLSKTPEGRKGMWVNEFPGQVERYQLAGWRVEQDPNFKSHEGQVQFGTQMDSVVRRVVTKDPLAQCKTAVWMTIPLEFYEEDHQTHQKSIDDRMDNLTAKRPGEYGGVEISN